MHHRVIKFKQILVFIICLLLILTCGMSSASADVDPDVENVNTLLEEIDSLQEMQNKRSTFTVSALYNAADEATVTEHEEVIAAYAAYIADMNQKRQAAQEAFDLLTPEQQDQVDPVLLAKLTDPLETTFSGESYELVPSTNEYNYQVLMIEAEKYYLAYELSMHATKDKDFPCTIMLADVSGDATSFTPDQGLYTYGTSNYEVTYCCDELQPTAYAVHYKRTNLEDCTYYNSYAASKLRAILQNTYPYISLEEMKANLIEAGVDRAEDLDRADVTAAVQFAVWFYSNRMTNAVLSDDTTYGYTFNALSYRAGGSRPLITSFHDYRNELWYWWNTRSTRDFVYDADADERVTSLFNYLIALPGVEASENQFVISDIQIVRQGLIDEGDGTYSIDLNIILNHGKAAGDEVILTVNTPTENKTIDVTGETQYQTTVKAKYGETITVTAHGTQYLEKGVYFYDPEGGYSASQALVGVAEGDTEVYAERSFIFNNDIDSGLRIYKTEQETGRPLEGIVFSVYDVTGMPASATPTEEELEAYATDAFLVGTMTTDSTGYAAMKLDYGTYLVVEEPNEKVQKPVDPFYVTLPEEENDVAERHLVNKEREEPGTTSVNFEATKDFNDWGKAESFTFELAAVTEGAPMPAETTAVATEDNPTAVFQSILFVEPGTYEYTITEINDGVDGVSYDTTPHNVIVTVTEEKTVSLEDESILTTYELVAEVDYDDADSLIITNTYTPAEASINVSKLLSGRAWEDADSFEVTLTAASDDNPMPETTVITLTKDAQTGTFGPIEFDKAGEYTYIVKETEGTEEFMEYDVAEHTVVITVSKADDETNALTAEVTYENGTCVEIKNTKNVPPTPADAEIWVTKLLSGRKWRDADSFEVTLTAVTEDAPMPETTVITLTKAVQSATFGEMTFDEEGIYEYYVQETAADEEGMSYDVAEHAVIITVTKDDASNSLVAEVTYESGTSVQIKNFKIPHTGDYYSIMLVLLIFFEAVLAMITLLLFREKIERFSK
ncbi:MAG: Cys-Gln thioester bond-forming surface protein [Erysipelotrichaceae bacterium]|nr:Cys-Gln thioester bond-forming surface protein [Erysipelotrichaceae bacterium]